MHGFFFYQLVPSSFLSRPSKHRHTITKSQLQMPLCMYTHTHTHRLTCRLPIFPLLYKNTCLGIIPANISDTYYGGDTVAGTWDNCSTEKNICLMEPTLNSMQSSVFFLSLSCLSGKHRWQEAEAMGHSSKGRLMQNS